MPKKLLNASFYKPAHSNLADCLLRLVVHLLPISNYFETRRILYCSFLFSTTADNRLGDGTSFTPGSMLYYDPAHLETRISKAITASRRCVQCYKRLEALFPLSITVHIGICVHLGNLGHILLV